MNSPIQPKDCSPERFGHLQNPMKRGWFEDLCMRDVFATGIHRAKQKPQPEELRFLLSSGARTRTWVLRVMSFRPEQAPSARFFGPPRLSTDLRLNRAR
jgi:hypothetical protein